jgi:hypothetical protein
VALWTVAVLWTVGLLWTLLLLSIPQGVKNLDDQDLLEIENRGIPRAIDLQFVGVRLRKPRSETQYCGDQL